MSNEPPEDLGLLDPQSIVEALLAKMSQQVTERLAGHVGPERDAAYVENTLKSLITMVKKSVKKLEDTSEHHTQAHNDLRAAVSDRRKLVEEFRAELSKATGTISEDLTKITNALERLPTIDQDELIKKLEEAISKERDSAKEREVQIKQADIDRIRSELDEVSTKHEDEVGKHNTTKGELASVRSQLDAEIKSVSKLQTKNEEVHQTLGKAENQITTHENKIRTLEAANKSLQDQLDSLDIGDTQANDKIQAKDRKIEQLEAELATAQDDATKANETLATLRTTSGEDALKSAEELGTWKGQCTQLQTRVAELQLANANANYTATSESSARAALTAQVNSLRAEVAAHTFERDFANARSRTATTTQAILQAENTRLQAENTRLKLENERAKTTIKNLSLHLGGAQASANRAGRDRLAALDRANSAETSSQKTKDYVLQATGINQTLREQLSKAQRSSATAQENLTRVKVNFDISTRERNKAVSELEAANKKAADASSKLAYVIGERENIQAEQQNLNDKYIAECRDHTNTKKQLETADTLSQTADNLIKGIAEDGKKQRKEFATELTDYKQTLVGHGATMDEILSSIKGLNVSSVEGLGARLDSISASVEAAAKKPFAQALKSIANPFKSSSNKGKHREEQQYFEDSREEERHATASPRASITSKRFHHESTAVSPEYTRIRRRTGSGDDAAFVPINEQTQQSTQRTPQTRSSAQAQLSTQTQDLPSSFLAPPSGVQQQQSQEGTSPFIGPITPSGVFSFNVISPSSDTWNPPEQSGASFVTDHHMSQAGTSSVTGHHASQDAVSSANITQSSQFETTADVQSRALPDASEVEPTRDDYLSPNSAILRGDFVVIDVSSMDRIQNSILNWWITGRWSKPEDYYRASGQDKKDGEMAYTWNQNMIANLNRQAKGGKQRCMMTESLRHATNWDWDDHTANRPCPTVNDPSGHHQCMKVIDETTLWLLNPQAGDFEKQERFDVENNTKQASSAGQGEGGGGVSLDTPLSPSGGGRLRRTLSQSSVGNSINTFYDRVHGKVYDRVHRGASIRSSGARSSASATQRPTPMPPAPISSRTGLSRSSNDQAIPALSGANFGQSQGTMPSRFPMQPHFPPQSSGVTGFTHRPESVSASSQSTIIHPSSNRGVPQSFTHPNYAEWSTSMSGNQFPGQTRSLMTHSRTGSGATTASFAPQSQLGQIQEENVPHGVDYRSDQILQAADRSTEDSGSTRPVSQNPLDLQRRHR